MLFNYLTCSIIIKFVRYEESLTTKSHDDQNLEIYYLCLYLLLTKLHYNDNNIENFN